MNIFRQLGVSLVDSKNTAFLADSIYCDIENDILKSEPMLTKLLDETVGDLYEAQEKIKRIVGEIEEINQVIR